MQIELDESDIQRITVAVIEGLKPYLTGKAAAQVETIIFDMPGLCAYLHVTPKWIHERTYLKEIPFIKLSNKQLRFRKKEVDAWLNTLHTPAIEQYRGKLTMVR